METTAIIAYLSSFTSIAAVILGNFIASRLNAWFDKRNQNKRARTFQNCDDQERAS